jgi:spore coat protein A, manganese oxidase
MLSRRQFLQSVAALGAASTFFWRGDVLYARAKETRVSAVVAAIEGGTLDPDSVPKFITPLLIPPVMPKAGTIKQKGKTVDYYEISMKQITQQILPARIHCCCTMRRH